VGPIDNETLVVEISGQSRQCMGLVGKKKDLATLTRWRAPSNAWFGECDVRIGWMFQRFKLLTQTASIAAMVPQLSPPTVVDRADVTDSSILLFPECNLLIGALLVQQGTQQ
jgi:hypothetical protein